MSGQWIRRQADEHVCDKPKYGESSRKIAVGDLWRCDGCGKTYEVTRVEYGDQRDPIPQGFVSQKNWREVKPPPGITRDS